MANRFEIGAFIGSGSYGAVFMAEDKHYDRKTVAVKRIRVPHHILNPSNVREMSLLQELHHPNIVRLISPPWIEDGYLCLAFEYFPATLLEDIRLRGEKYCEWRKPCLEQILRAVDYCHSHQVIHRDLKPQNILLDRSGVCLFSNDPPTLKIADFGTARAFLTPDKTLTPKVATSGYRAPEIILGDPAYSTPIDIWSIGCIFAEIVTGTPLFLTDTDITAVFSLLGGASEENWTGVSSLPGYQRDFSRLPRKDMKAITRHFETIFPDLEPAGINLLAAMLTLDPNKRITAKAALEHVYFT